MPIPLKFLTYYQMFRSDIFTLLVGLSLEVTLYISLSQVLIKLGRITQTLLTHNLSFANQMDQFNQREQYIKT